jgi:hypothetical protein
MRRPGCVELAAQIRLSQHSPWFGWLAGTLSDGDPGIIWNAGSVLAESSRNASFVALLGIAPYLV